METATIYRHCECSRSNLNLVKIASSPVKALAPRNDNVPETILVKGPLVGCTPRDDTQREPRLPKLFALIFIVSFLCVGCNRQTNSPAVAAPITPVGNYDRQLQINSQTLNVEIAGTPAEQQQGLSGRKAMADNQGMLFAFGSLQTPAFWMKDMDFNLDFIWIAGGKVIGITSDVLAPVNCQSSIVNC